MKMIMSLVVMLVMGALIGCQNIKHSNSGKSFEATIPAADGVTISYDVRGSGNTALVFVHGWCSNRTFWREQLDVMAHEFRVVAIDLPGHGASGRDRDQWSFTSFADDVVKVVETLDLKRVVLVGHSMGGVVSLEVAQRLPDRVIGVVGLDTIGDADSEDPPEMMERVIAAFEADFEGTMNAFMPRMFSPDAAPELVRWAIDSSVNADHVMALSIMRDIANVDEKKLLSSVAVPVRCIYAATDDPSHPATLVETNSKYADFDAVYVEGVGHFLHLENPGEVNRQLRAALTELEQP